MTTKTSPPAATVVKIKKEIPNDEIKDFAETAMNELLGWYGYDSVDRIDLSAKSSRLLGSINSSENHNRRDINGNRSSHRDDSTISDRDSSREDSKSPSSIKTNEKPDNYCGWCRRHVPEKSPEFLATPDGPRYCSESCFSQSRRASFKRAKTCDWCRHVRHAVSYVDFQDGASQLQFCSDKCLNQYKMQIFCKETQAHLDMNPHLKEKGAAASSGGLITPDLWMKNCRSRSASPASDISRSSTPKQSQTVSQHQQQQHQTQQQLPHQKQHQQQPLEHKPVITVAPASKLLSRSTHFINTRQSSKHARKRRLSKLLSIQNNSCNSINNNIGNNNTSLISHSKILANCLTNATNVSKPCTYTSVQDLRLNVPPISPAESPQLQQQQQQQPHQQPHQQQQQQQHQLPIRPPNRPHPFFAPSPNTFTARQPFMPGHPRLMGFPMSHPIPQMPVMDMSGLSAMLGGVAPPVTVMVPYPIIVPLPIPIPIPLPIIDFLKAATNTKYGEGASNNNKSCLNNDLAAESKVDSKIRSPQPQEPSNEPLDFTKSKVTPSDPMEKESSSCQINETDVPLKIEKPISPPVVIDDDENDADLTEQKLPKFKITRLHTKRLITKESENSRPLRKRKRVIDCDYLRTTKEEEYSSRNKK